jgi:hypothetical protein
MAFTEAQRVTVRRYLGRPPYATWDTMLEGSLQTIGALPDAQAAVEDVLANLATIESEIKQLHGIALASKVEESMLNPRRYEDLRGAGRREVQALAGLMGTEPVRDVFSPGWAGGSMRMG